MFTLAELPLGSEQDGLLVVALVVSTPLMALVIGEWLSGFAARIPVSVWLFLIPGLVVLFVALLTVSFHTTRVAFTNPVKSLRYE